MTTDETAVPASVRVHLLELPVPVAAKARQHFEGLMREFALIAAGNDSDSGAHPVPLRLMHLVDTLTAQFAGVNTDAEERLAEAINAGADVIDDHVLELPPAAGPASQALGDLLDEADDYCLRGDHLLTLATPPDCLAYRRWYLGEVIAQLEGEAPTPWPDSPQA